MESDHFEDPGVDGR